MVRMTGNASVLRCKHTALGMPMVAWRKADGASDLQIFLRIGLPLTRAAFGTVAILQGRSEFIEKYFETISDLLARGF